MSVKEEKRNGGLRNKNMERGERNLLGGYHPSLSFCTSQECEMMESESRVCVCVCVREIVFNSVKKGTCECVQADAGTCVCVCVRHSFTSVQSQLRLVSSLLSTLPRSDSLSCLFFFQSSL